MYMNYFDDFVKQKELDAARRKKYVDDLKRKERKEKLLKINKISKEK